MLVKFGVDISKLKRPMRRALCHVEKIYAFYGFEAIITSTFEGNHIPCSLHYTHLAIDVRHPPSRRDDVFSDLKGWLGDDYDVIDELGHFHIEYDP